MKQNIAILGAFIIGLFTFTAFGQNGVWTTNVAAISPRALGAAATIGGKVYMVGGGDYGCNVFSALQAYDPATNVWVSLANMPSARYEFAATELNGQLYAIGGNTGCGAPMSVVEAYNPVSNSWSSKALLLTASWGLGAASANGKIYVFDGFATNVYCYDPGSNSWSVKTPAPAPCNFGVVAEVNGIIYLIGIATGGGPKAGVYAYNPVADSWTTKASMPTARDQCAVAALNGIIYVAGGSSSTGIVATVEAYHTATDTWSTVAPLPFRLYGASAAAVNGTLYVMGGFNVGNATIGSVEAFTPSPVLTIATSGNQSVLFWPASGTNYILQSTTNLASTNWITASDAVPVIAFTVTNTSPARLFRLVQP